MAAAFDDDLVEQVATAISIEGRAFGNVGRAGMDYYAPNVNPFRDPRWGRGQGTLSYFELIIIALSAAVMPTQGTDIYVDV